MRQNHYSTCSKLGQEILEGVKKDICDESFADIYAFLEGEKTLDEKNFFNEECMYIIQSCCDNDFSLGSALKYLWRLGKNKDIEDMTVDEVKKTYEDLSKSAFYLLEYQSRDKSPNSIGVKKGWVGKLINLMKKYLTEEDLKKLEEGAQECGLAKAERK